MRFALHIFNGYTWSIWIALAATTVISEVVPVPHMNAILHYGVYSTAKLASFMLVGFFTPLVFERFNALNRGIAFAAVCAAVVELLQGLIGNGHSFHAYELLAKWIVILFGFMVGLDARYESCLTFGTVRIVLTTPGIHRERAT